MISCWGDSMVMGGVDQIPFTVPLSALTGLHVSNFGISGETSTQVRQRFMAAPERWSDTTVFWLGRCNYLEPTLLLRTSRQW